MYEFAGKLCGSWRADFSPAIQMTLKRQLASTQTLLRDSNITADKLRDELV
jgi:hypothetical protein